MDLNNPAHRQAIEVRLNQLRQTVPQIATHQTLCEGSVGDNLVQCKNAYQCFDGYDLEDVGYAIETNSLKNCYDMTVCFKTEESYQCVHCSGNYGLKFSIHCDGCSESEFCAYSKNLRNCFGCVYLQDKQFYILNQPYSEADYYAKVAEIKQELIEAGQYNLLPFFVSDYEQERLLNETDPAINP
ncbi:hypothetical protein IPJ72_00505 [Candidatus Peregrinibacteria bacterium]|nr:MAG: hypothetical protein IPJ72_00505 [Candidatus Peregrinibacteria bacterium]